MDVVGRERKGFFFLRKAYMVLCDHGTAGRGCLEAREEMDVPGECHSVATPLLSPVSRLGGELGELCGSHLPS